MPGRGKIDDGEPPMPERDSAVVRLPCALVIGTAVTHRVRHRQCRLGAVFEAARPRDTTDSTHLPGPPCDAVEDCEIALGDLVCSASFNRSPRAARTQRCFFR